MIMVGLFSQSGCGQFLLHHASPNLLKICCFKLNVLCVYIIIMRRECVIICRVGKCITFILVMWLGNRLVNDIWRKLQCFFRLEFINFTHSANK